MVKLRVVLIGTGFVGRLSLKALIEHPMFELVGIGVHNPAKVGTDAGALAGTGPTGILATNDTAALVELGADCLVSTAEGNGNEEWFTDIACRFLAAGTNVVSTSISGLIHPRTWYRQDLVGRIEAAALSGGASFLASGMDPGLSSDLAINLIQASSEWNTIRIQENYNYATYLPNGAEALFRDGLGFGQPMDFTPQIFQPGALSSIWGGPTVTLVAEALGVELDEIREFHWRHPADATFDIPRLGTIREGTQEAYRFEVQGIVGGHPAIIAEHITRLRENSAPQWSCGYAGEGYYIEIEGDPVIRSHHSFAGSNGDHQYGAILATGMKVVNAIGAVCDARPGLLTAPADLPPSMPKGLFRLPR